MVGYCRTTDCLHRYMTRYFGQNCRRMLVPRRVKTLRRTLLQSGKCGACSNCESTFETIDVTRVAQAISRCVHDVGQRVGSGKIVKDPARFAGTGSGMAEPGADAHLRHAQGRERGSRARRVEPDGYGRVPVNRRRAYANRHVRCAGGRNRRPDFHYEIKRVERKSEAAGSGRSGGVADTADSANVPGDALGSYIPDDDEESLFQKLRELRHHRPGNRQAAVHRVLRQDLRDMARIKPVTNAQFLAVNGVGQHKLDLYGQRFMQAIASFNAGSAS